LSDRYIVSWWDDAKKVIIVPVSLLFLVVGTISEPALTPLPAEIERSEKGEYVHAMAIFTRKSTAMR